MVAKRKSLPNRLRFEVFKRDKFRCQYCGVPSPEAVLQVDHVHPVAEGGTDDLANLVASCFECNSGKSDKLLSDDSAIAKQRAELERQQERVEQIEMIARWREFVADDLKHQVSVAEEEWRRWSSEPHSLTESGHRKMRNAIRKHGLVKVCECIAECADRCDNDALEALGETFRTLSFSAAAEKDPMLPKVLYVRGIIANRTGLEKDWRLTAEIRGWLAEGWSIEEIEAEAKRCDTLYELRRRFEDGGSC